MIFLSYFALVLADFFYIFAIYVIVYKKRLPFLYNSTELIILHKFYFTFYNLFNII